MCRFFTQLGVDVHATNNRGATPAEIGKSRHSAEVAAALGGPPAPSAPTLYSKGAKCLTIEWSLVPHADSSRIIFEVGAAACALAFPDCYLCSIACAGAVLHRRWSLAPRRSQCEGKHGQGSPHAKRLPEFALLDHPVLRSVIWWRANRTSFDCAAVSARKKARRRQRRCAMTPPMPSICTGLRSALHPMTSKCVISLMFPETPPSFSCRR
jgi:hypothetical protein